jgi:hypothetical protein
LHIIKDLIFFPTPRLTHLSKDSSFQVPSIRKKFFKVSCGLNEIERHKE